MIHTVARYRGTVPIPLRQAHPTHYVILESSGRDNAKFTTGTKKMLIMGKLGVLVTAALATYQILDAENKPKEAARQGIIVGAGALGGILSGMGVSTLCGPAMPICAIAVGQSPVVSLAKRWPAHWMKSWRSSYIGKFSD